MKVSNARSPNQPLIGRNTGPSAVVNKDERPAANMALLIKTKK